MKAQRIEKYPFTTADNLLLDANIWIFLYCPHGDPSAHEPNVYSEAFKRILAAESKIFVNSTVLSEFIYRYCRLAHDLLIAKGAAPSRFKSFRKSAPFKMVAKAVADASRRVLRDAIPVDDGFASLDTARTLADLESGKHDFNDLLIARVCAKRELTLVTDDEDFALRGVSILTANAMLAT